MKFPFVRPEIPRPEEWTSKLDRVYDRRYFTNFGPVETDFSRALADQFGKGDAEVTLACNATAALTAALIAHGVQGLVAVPDFTFPATLTAILAAGCTPLICDVDADTGELDIDALARRSSMDQVRAIMPVRTYGFVRDLSRLFAFAESRAIPVIVDSAAALGSWRVTIGPGVTEVFSLHATKSFGIGEGGAIFSHKDLRPRLMSALNFGLKPDRTFGLGLNGKMSEFQAAIGLAQLAQIDRLIQGRQSMADWYFSLLEGRSAGYRFPTDPGPTPWSNFPIFLAESIDAEQFQNRAHTMGYQIRRYYHPTLSRGHFGNAPPDGHCATAERLSACAICLPLYSDLQEDEKADIAAIVDTLFSDIA